MYIIACKVFYYEIQYVIKKLNINPYIIFLEQSLHDSPEQLTIELQKTIDELELQGVTEIYLCYGLCGRGIAKVRTKKATIIMPKVHDCISLFMGEILEKEKNVFWLTKGWMEYSQLPFLEHKEKRFLEYKEKYGEDNASYLMSLEDTWLSEYQSAKLIYWDHVGKLKELEESAKYIADKANLPYSSIKGNESFLFDLLAGVFDKRFVKIPPGNYIDINGDGEITIF